MTALWYCKPAFKVVTIVKKVATAKVGIKKAAGIGVARRSRPTRKLAAAAVSKPAIVGWVCIATGGGFWATGQFDTPVSIRRHEFSAPDSNRRFEFVGPISGFPANSGVFEVPGEFLALPPDAIAFAPVPDCCSPAPQPGPDTTPEQPQPVPEPPALALLATGLVVLAIARGVGR